jgi:hypothetical protein
MAEIVNAQPSRFSDYLSIAFHLIVSLEEEDLGHFRAGALWAAGRLAQEAQEDRGDVLPAVVAALDNSDPQVRGIAAWCLEQMSETGLLARRADLLTDDGPVDFYEGRQVKRTTVGSLVRLVLAPETAGS